MNPQWQFNPLSIPLGLSTLLIVGLFALGWRHRDKPMAGPYFALMCSLMIWMTASMLEILTLNLQLSLLFADISFLGITSFPIIWLTMILKYMGKERLFRSLRPWLLVVPILTNLVIWTNPLHNLWRGDSYRDLETTWFPISYYEYGPWFYYFHVPFSLGIVFTAIGLLLRSRQMQEPFYRTQSITVLVAFCVPLVVAILDLIGFELISYYNVSTLVFPLSGFLLGWALLGFRFLDLMPIARDVIVESMADMMIVLDDRKRIVDVNPAARKQLLPLNSPIIGLDIHEILVGQHNLIDRVPEDTPVYREIQIDRKEEIRSYNVTYSRIKHPSRQKSGLLLLLQDVTERKLAQAAYRAEAEKVAVLQERQRIARELHDSVNQTLFAASGLTDLLPLAIYDKPEKLPEYAASIQQLIQGATAQMRIVLLELHPDALAKTDLGTILTQLCNAFTGNTGIVVQLTAAPQVYLAADAQFAFYRITQEALHNIGKHAAATEVRVRLTRCDCLIELSIQDNGTGFDVNNTPPDHFGLRNMNERADEIGATIQISSQINQGTSITLRKELS